MTRRILIALFFTAIAIPVTLHAQSAPSDRPFAVE